MEAIMEFLLLLRIKKLYLPVMMMSIIGKTSFL